MAGGDGPRLFVRQASSADADALRCRAISRNAFWSGTTCLSTPGFVDHARGRGWTPPELSDNELEHLADTFFPDDED